MPESQTDKSTSNFRITPYFFGSLWLWLGNFELPSLLLLLYIAITTYILYQYLLEMAKVRRAIFFDSYIAPDSTMQRHREISTIMKRILQVSSLFLSVVTSFAVFNFGSTLTFMILVGITLGFTISAWAQKFWLRHIHLTHRYYIESKFVTVVAASTGAIILFFCEMISTRSDHSTLNSDQAANLVIQEIHHPVKIVQHLARTNQYVSYTILRMRDNLDSTPGMLIYAYLIIPNLLPIYGMVILLKGCQIKLTTTQI